MILHADPCKLCMHHSLQNGWPEKGLQNAKDRHTKAAGQAAAVWVNEPGGMQNHNVPAFDVLLPVPVVLPVRFPAVAVQ